MPPSASTHSSEVVKDSTLSFGGAMQLLQGGEGSQEVVMEPHTPPPVPESSDADLERLFVTDGERILRYAPSFQPDISSFTLSVPNDVEFVIVTAFTNSDRAHAAVKLGGIRVEEVTDPFLAETLLPGDEWEWETDSEDEEALAAAAAVPSFAQPPAGAAAAAPPPSGGPDAPNPNAASTYESVAAQQLAGMNDPSAYELTGVAGAQVAAPATEVEFVLPKSFKVPLVVGKNPVYVVTAAQNGDTRTVAVRVIRQEWSPTGWQEKYADELDFESLSPDDMNRNKFAWYVSGAMRGYPAAQHQLALMYAGEDGYGLDENWRRVEGAEASLEHLRWLLRAANQQHLPAQERLAALYAREEVSRGFHADQEVRDELQQAMRAEGDEHGEPSTPEQLDYQEESGTWYRRAANNGSREAALAMADRYLRGVGCKPNFRRAILWMRKAGRTLEEAEDTVVEYFKTHAEQGDSLSALQLAKIYIDGVGVPMDFDTAKFWFMRAGKSDSYARQQVTRKQNTLRPFYRDLFRAHDASGNGGIDRNEFMGYYRDCLMAKGFSRRRADAETVSAYQGSIKSDIAFKAYDINGDGRISFSEMWEMRERVSTLVPSTEKHYLAAVAFFSKWKASVSRELGRREGMDHPSSGGLAAHQSGALLGPDEETPREDAADSETFLLYRQESDNEIINPRVAERPSGPVPVRRRGGSPRAPARHYDAYQGGAAYVTPGGPGDDSEPPPQQQQQRRGYRSGHIGLDGEVEPLGAAALGRSGSRRSGGGAPVSASSSRRSAGGGRGAAPRSARAPGPGKKRRRRRKKAPNTARAARAHDADAEAAAMTAAVLDQEDAVTRGDYNPISRAHSGAHHHGHPKTIERFVNPVGRDPTRRNLRLSQASMEELTGAANLL